jgi:hypothetical protein
MIQVTEVVHNHVDDHHVFVTEGIDKPGSEITIADAVLKCKFCKDLSNQQIGMQALEISVFDFAVAIHSQTLTALYTQKLFDVAVHTWTNKGPPIS